MDGLIRCYEGTDRLYLVLLGRLFPSQSISSYCTQVCARFRAQSLWWQRSRQTIRWNTYLFLPVASHSIWNLSLRVMPLILLYSPWQAAKKPAIGLFSSKAMCQCKFFCPNHHICDAKHLGAFPAVKYHFDFYALKNFTHSPTAAILSAMARKCTYTSR